jgi:hypothetical protein
MVRVKTTLDIQDALLDRAKRHAKRVHRPLRAIVEEGLRRVLADSSARGSYVLPDASVGDADAPDPLEALSWQDLRAEMYGEPSFALTAIGLTWLLGHLAQIAPATRP